MSSSDYLALRVEDLEKRLRIVEGGYRVLRAVISKAIMDGSLKADLAQKLAEEALQKVPDRDAAADRHGQIPVDVHGDSVTGSIPKR